ncbi:MAG: hypothetical protein PG981_000150 [Wolbachia endosymbiont of Ctenocephalides orientis wCori]|nr:MAG: hypothetical protein PG981_000150 [Wolbachia endosymbiont of Ctenocephalides orientis wCori]
MQHNEEAAEGATPSKRARMEDAVIENLTQLSLQ